MIKQNITTPGISTQSNHSKTIILHKIQLKTIIKVNYDFSIQTIEFNTRLKKSLKIVGKLSVCHIRKYL